MKQNKIGLKVMKEFAADFRIFVTMYYNYKGKPFSRTNVEVDFLQGITKNKTDLIIFWDDIFNGLDPKTDIEARCEAVGMSKTPYYERYTNILRDLYKVYSGSFTIIYNK